VCDGTAEQMAHCAQLFEDDADDTIVRLPDNVRPPLLHHFITR